MISLDIKKETSSLLPPLNIAPTEQKEGALSFSALLKGTQELDDKIIQNGSLILALKDEKAPANLLSTQNMQDMIELESLELDPKVSAAMTPEDLKVLIKQAKQFLKDKIVQSEGFKKAEIDAIPKTLGGLVQVAKKIGIDISKITLEEVKAQIPKASIKSVEPLHVKANSKTTKPQKEQKEPLHVNKEVKQDVVPENEELPVEIKVKTHKVHTVKTQEIDTTEENLDMAKKETVKNTQQVKQEVKLTPLFKAQNTIAPEITTQQIVSTKVNNLTAQKNPKQKADETLQLLLRGEKVSKNDIGLTADFSVATAKVIAPQATKEVDKSLASLLKNDVSDDGDIQTKTDGWNVSKADSFEVKLHEAKQMVKYLSQDVKSAIEDYKSPFTRVKVQLNPQRLGEVDLTIVQRGKNLHINLSSNNTAINTLAMNANDLKAQLNNNGINNASLNFNSNAQSENSQAGQQEQQRQNQQRADEEYNYFESKESHEEVISSLEIIVPHYA
ncbi:flagellar hook-length control protein FliK [Sulfurimonas autotrophica]|uniref:Flagellar hook-length control protein n=1 Tax=Sulfurimonas autotrophica (strain ATCC BAA-671 / DSM 16294 / JCM 11897 / OK10) TaxID=563040 RepID=E0USR2_SULAO|nr:flagellar hook-length control protein FliK [Sulfurimonas autotrophica]ADN08089.1 flagellar hook-length control protein [Sulfurimonas autotrophica DSM 16294]